MNSTHEYSFDAQACLAQLSTTFVGSSFWFYNSLPSTNTHLKKCSPHAIRHGLICLTDDQYEGRGQYSRQWVSAPRKNLTFSLALRKAKNQNFHLLNIASAAVLCQMLQSQYHIPATVKWPNDVYVGERKIAGFLTEASFCGNEIEKVIVGAGINVNHNDFATDWDDFATSIFRETGSEVCRESCLAMYLNDLEQMILRWDSGRLDCHKLINENLKLYGKWVFAEVDGKRKEGTYKVLGVNNEGYLRLLDEAMNVRTITHQNLRIHEY